MTVEFVPSVLQEGDTLASLAALYGVDAVTLAEANGVAPSPGRARDCAWGRRVEARVLETGGRRLPAVPSTPNRCAPGLGFAAFVAGQVWRLPPGGPRRAVASPAAPDRSGGGGGLFLLLLAAGAAALVD